MSGFKGTKGPWYVVNGYIPEIGNCISISETQKNRMLRTLVCVISHESNLRYEDLPNALLISKAPEMIEMLERLSNLHPDGNPIELIKEAKQLIKSATEL